MDKTHDSCHPGFISAENQDTREGEEAQNHLVSTQMFHCLAQYILNKK